MNKELMEARLNYLIELVEEYDELIYSFEKDGKYFEVINYEKNINTLINLKYNGKCWVNYVLKKMNIFN